MQGSMKARDSRSLASWLLVACIVAMTAVVYAPVAEHEFLNFDDLNHVANNPRVSAPLTPSALLTHFRRPAHGNWLPLSTASLQLSHAIHGPNPAAFASTNVALHLLSTVLVFVALRRMTGAVWRSAFVAGVFALHPLHVESVAWIAERKDVLAGSFWMLGLYAYARYVEEPGSKARYAALVLCLTLGLLSKSTLVTFPFVLLLLDHWPLDRLRGSVRAVVAEKLPLLAIVLVSIGVTYATQAAGGQMRVGNRLSLLARAANAVESYVFYLGDAFWPSDLAALYLHPYTHVQPNALDLTVAGLLAMLLLAAAAVCVSQRRARPYLAVGWLWYLGTLLPMIGIVQVGLQARADRYAYIPLVGIAIAAAWGAADLAGSSASRRRLTVAVGASALIASAIVARTQVGFWHDTFTLYERVVAVSERNGYAHEMLGYEYAAIDRNTEAARHFAEAVRVNPGRVQSLFGLAVTRSRLGQTEEAIEAYQAGLRLQPDKTRAHGELGVLLASVGRDEEAAVHLRRALSTLPNEETFRRALTQIERTNP